MSNLPPLKIDPKYGYFPWWPEEGDDRFHPDDLAAARALIPSGRIFRRAGRDGDYQLMHYGEVTLRVKPTLWQEVEPEGFEIGDWVEVLSRGLANEPRTGTIAEIGKILRLKMDSGVVVRNGSSGATGKSGTYSRPVLE